MTLPGTATKGMQIRGAHARLRGYDRERRGDKGKQPSVRGGLRRIQRGIIATGLGL